MNKKVEITIRTEFEDGKKCQLSIGDKAFFTDVSFSAPTYGACSPCRTKEDIKNTIERFKQNIIKAGDIPIINDERNKKNLLDWT